MCRELTYCMRTRTADGRTKHRATHRHPPTIGISIKSTNASVSKCQRLSTGLGHGRLRQGSVTCAN